jgi:hypothetical protein
MSHNETTRLGRCKEALRSGPAKKAYSFAMVVFAVAAVLYHQQPEIGYHDRLARWGLPMGAVCYAGLRAWAGGLFTRENARAVAAEIGRVVSVGRGVTSRLSGVEARSVALALLVVTSMFVGSLTLSMGPLPAADNASAFSEKTVVGGTTTGIVKAYDTSGNLKWSRDLGSGNVHDIEFTKDTVFVSHGTTVYKLAPSDGSIISQKSLSVDYGGLAISNGYLFAATGSDVDVRHLSNLSLKNSFTPSFANGGGAIDAGPNGRVYGRQGYRSDGGGIFEVDSTGILQSKSFSGNGGIDVLGNSIVTATYDGSTGRLRRYSKDLSVQTSTTDVATSGVAAGTSSYMFGDYYSSGYYIRKFDGTTNIAQIAVGTPNMLQYSDGYVYLADGAGLHKIDDGLSSTSWNKTANGYSSVSVYNVDDYGVTVDGKITGGEGSGIDGATVELLQSGSVVKSTTTASDGSYSFSGVSDGDYSVRASADGYQNKSQSITVSGSPRTVDLTLYEEDTYEQTFILDDKTGAFVDASLIIEKWNWVEQEWTGVHYKRFNAENRATARLEKGTTYRYIVQDTIPLLGTAHVESTGWTAGEDVENPYTIVIDGPPDDRTISTPTATAGPTPTGDYTSTPTEEPVSGGGGGSGGDDGGTGATATDTATGCAADLDGDHDDDGTQNWADADCVGDDGDADDGSLQVEGPSVLGTCTTADGSDGIQVEYYDPFYETTELEYNLTGPNGSRYTGTQSFDPAIGFWAGCVGDQLTNNASDDDDIAVTGNYTRNGTTSQFSSDYDPGSAVAALGPVGQPPQGLLGQGLVLFLTLGGVLASLYAGRRWFPPGEDWPLPDYAGPVGLTGAGIVVLLGANFASGNLLLFGLAVGVEQVAPALLIIGFLGGGYIIYKEFVQGDDVVLSSEVASRRGGGR